MIKQLEMKLTLLFTLTILGILKINAQLNIKQINESLVKINNNLYASKYELSNKIYNDFISSLKNQKDIEKLQLAQIDTLKWLDKTSYNEPYVKYYHTHPAYLNYPVVNVSYTGATLFCEWLTEEYNRSKNKKFKKVIFRLPTEKEWMIAAQGGDTSAIYPWKEKTLRNKNGQYLFNYKQELSDTMWIDGKYVENTDVTAPVKSYWANNYGIYNMGGNAAEMILEKGSTKGGSWREDALYMKIKNKNNFDGSGHSNIGFRYFMEVIEK